MTSPFALVEMAFVLKIGLVAEIGFDLDGLGV
jgi:hypothetical protein